MALPRPNEYVPPTRRSPRTPRKPFVSDLICVMSPPHPPFSLPLQSLMFLGCVAAAGLGLNLLCLAIYLSCLCCCRKEEEEEESKKPNSCCVTWSAVAAGLITW